MLTRVGRPTCFVIMGTEFDDNGEEYYLLSRAEDDASPDVLDPVAKGAYRLVCECVAAHNAARRLA